MNHSIQSSEPLGCMSRTSQLARRSFTWAALVAALAFLFLQSPAARADISPPGCTGSGLGILLYTAEPDVHIGDVLHYSVTVFNGTGFGPVVCDASSIQAFITTPDGVSHSISLVRTNLSNGQSDFYNEVVSYVVRAQDIQSDGTVRATATDTGVIHQNVVNSQGGGNQGVNTVVDIPNIGITASCSGGVGENGAITFSGTVTNSGNNTLANVVVTNSVNGGQYVVATFTNLAVGQVVTFSGSYVPANPCSPSTATFTAAGTDLFTAKPRTVTSTANTTCVNALAAGIAVGKSCPLQPVAPGQLLTYTGSVTNTGNVTLTGIVVVDSQPSANTTVFTAAALAPGAVTNFSASFIAPTNCAVTDVLVGTGSSVCGVPVSSAVTNTCPILTTPALAVTLNCPQIPAQGGRLLNYSGTVVNVGNITLLNVKVLHNLSGSTPVFTALTLAPGASAAFNGSYLASIDCSSTSTATASAISACGVGVTNSATTTCPVTTTPGVSISQSCPANAPNAGGVLTYSGTVVNTGNVILTNVLVYNNLSGEIPVFVAAHLLPGVSTNFTGSFIAPTGCSVTSISTVTGETVCGDLASNSVSSTCPISTSPGLTITQNCPPTPVVPGGLLAYSGTVLNSGNVTMTNIVVLNDLTGLNYIADIASLAPGQSANFSGSFIAPTNCSVTTTTHVSGRSICGVVANATVTTTCAITTVPVLNITQTCPANPPAPGATLTYTGTVSNGGNITLNNIVVLNNLSGGTPVFRAASLAPGATAVFTGSYVTPTNCSVTSISTASALSSCGVPVTNTVVSTCPISTTPALRVTQVCQSVPTVPGATLTFTGLVVNTGNIPLNNVVVVNDQSGVIFNAQTLAPGASGTFSGSFLTPTNCSITSTSLATGTSSCGIVASNSVTTTCSIVTTPGLTLQQNCPDGLVTPGGLLTYYGTVLNSGNVTMTNIVVYNNLSGLRPVADIGSLAPGQSASYSGSFLAPTNCSVTSTTTASGRSTCGVVANATTTATCPIGTAPALNITQNCPVNPPVPGAVLTYSGTVVNAGNITLTNIVVVNSQSGVTPVLRLPVLAPGATAIFTGSFVTPTNCSVTSVSTATAGSTCGVPVSNQVVSTCPISTTPALRVTQICPVNPVVPGGALTVSGTVLNTGNITLTNVNVINDHIGVVFHADTLAPGAGSAFTGSYVAPAICSSTSTSIATGLSICGVAATNSATSTCPITTTPGILLSLSCPATPASPGGLLTYSGSLVNTGNVTITNLVVHNNLNGLAPVFIANALEPGVTTNFTASYVAPTNCSSTSTAQASGRSICGVAVSSSATQTCPILSAPDISVVQFCPNIAVVPGGLLTYSGSVSNSGNATLTNIVVTSDRPAANTKIFTVASLAPGARAFFTGSYSTPSNCCVVSSTVSASGQACSGATVTDTYTRTCVVQTQPGIVVTSVRTNGIIRPGDLLTYSGSVSNSGNITLVNVSVSESEDPNHSPLGAPIDLAPGQSVPFYGSFVVQPDFCGTHTITASSLNVCTYGPVTGSVTVTSPITTGPRISVTKNCPASPTPRGGLYTYTGTVSNDGDVSLMNVYVVNNQPTNNTPVIGPITLAPGASASFTNSYIAPTCCCLIIDTLTAKGSDHCSASNVTATSTAVCPLLTTPGIALLESCPALPIALGGQLLFSGIVTNTGNVVLTNVWVYGPLGTNQPVLGPLQLAPGETESYFGTFTNVFNTAALVVTAVGQDTCAGHVVTNTITCPVVQTPTITRITEVNGLPASPGGNPTPAQYSITFPTSVGNNYTVQYKNNLQDPAWTNLTTVPGTGANQTVMDSTSAGQPARYYRVMNVPASNP